MVKFVKRFNDEELIPKMRSSEEEIIISVETGAGEEFDLLKLSLKTGKLHCYPDIPESLGFKLDNSRCIIIEKEDI